MPDEGKRLIVVIITGIRPETIIMCSMALSLGKKSGHFQSIVIVASQHKGMPNSMSGMFNVNSRNILDVLEKNQNLSKLAANVILDLDPFFPREYPSFVRPVPFLKNETEGPVAIAVDTIKLTGTETGAIIKEVSHLLKNQDAHAGIATTVNSDGAAKGGDRFAGFL